jgi:hypothetical protein
LAYLLPKPQSDPQQPPPSIILAAGTESVVDQILASFLIVMKELRGFVNPDSPELNQSWAERQVLPEFTFFGGSRF